MTLFRTYIDTTFNGNQALAARTLGVSRSMISRIVRGERGVSPALAKRIEDASGGEFRKEQFIWGDEVVLDNSSAPNEAQNKPKDDSSHDDRLL